MKTGKPEVSVVIPTYNRADDLMRALQSLRAQSYTNWEAIVVDNHSTDNTDEVINGLNDPRIFIYKIHNNGVIAASRNMGIDHANGEFVAFLDSDDWWTKDKLEKSVNKLKQGFDLVYHDLWVVIKNGKNRFKKKVDVRQLTKPVFNDLILNGSAIPNSSVVVRTDLLKKINGLSEDIKLIAAEDYDCWLRLSLITDRFVCLPETLGYYWLGLNNNSDAKRRSVNLKELQKLYFDPFVKKHNIEVPTWILYQNVRATYLLGNVSEAIILLKKLSKRSLTWRVRLKVFFMYVKIKSLHING